MDNENVVISISNLNKTFRIKDRNTSSVLAKVSNIFNPNKSREIKALENINLEIKKGEFFGIIGSNGSGKSTLLKIMTSVYQPDKGGEIKITGDFQRLALATGFDNELTARENIFLNGSLHGLSFKKIRVLFKSILQFAELEKFVDTKVKYFSSGMISRLAFSIAVNIDADILFLDEFGGVGDASFREKSERVFKDLIFRGKTIVHVSHDLGTISEYCDRVLLLDKGKQILIDKPDVVLASYSRIVKKNSGINLYDFLHNETIRRDRS
jgi:ABC-2 type transport system ATP-binding protein